MEIVHMVHRRVKENVEKLMNAAKAIDLMVTVVKALNDVKVAARKARA